MCSTVHIYTATDDLRVRSTRQDPPYTVPWTRLACLYIAFSHHCLYHCAVRIRPCLHVSLAQLFGNDHTSLLQTNSLAQMGLFCI